MIATAGFRTSYSRRWQRPGCFVNGMAQFGVLLMLLLTGMETDLKLVRKVSRASIFASVFGIVVPFACGFALGELCPTP